METRAVSEIREIDEAEHAAHIRLVTYHRADTYGSTWLPGVFDESLASRHVPAVWSHDRAAIIGSIREHDLQPTHADVNLAFADFDAVPEARKAYSLMRDRHVRESSFGFSRVKGGTVDRRSDPNFTPSQPGERERMSKANLVEVSVVLKGSVPDNGVLAVRADPTEADTDLAWLILQRAPHGYKATNGDGSVCAVCGGMPDAKVHTMTRAAVYELGRAPVRQADPQLLIRAADAAVDAALKLLPPEADDAPPTAAFSLLWAADAMLDRSQDLLALPDVDDEDGPVGALARALAEPAPEPDMPPAEPVDPPPADPQPAPVDDEVTRELDRILGRADPAKPYGDVAYADPGYQDDKQKRYPLDTAAHVRAAWSYVNQNENRTPYSAEQLKTIEGRIKAAGKRFGITFADESEPAGAERGYAGLEHREFVALLAAAGLPVEIRAGTLLTGSQRKLTEYWVTGPGRAKVMWGVPGDFDRCVAELSKYVTRAKGLCERYHELATGAPPGHAPGEKYGRPH